MSYQAAAKDCAALFQDLASIQKIDEELHDALPFLYNSSFVGGYFTMPSARMPKSGNLAIGIALVNPYVIFGANFAVFNRVELSANYRVFKGIEEGNFGKEGFGDDADRIGNVKFGILQSEDSLAFLPELAFGLDDAIGTKRFHSKYFVATKSFLDYNLELSLGYGWGRIKGFFGGVAFSPFRKGTSLLKGLSLITEYDANDYAHHHAEHCHGRSVKNRWNYGANYTWKNCLQLQVHSVRGEKVGGLVAASFPFGSTEWIIPKTNDPPLYTCPIDQEPIGYLRKEKEFACDLAWSFADQGLDLYEAYLLCDQNFEKELYVKVVNNRYRREKDVRQRIQELLSAVTPCNISRVVVTIEADGVESHSYTFRTCDLYQLQNCCMSTWELETISPKQEASCWQDPYQANPLLESQRRIWTITARPRLISFFGSTSGKFKYSFAAVASSEGYLPLGVIYNLQGSYSVYSSVHGLTNKDRLNPSELLHVRTDAVKYYQEGRFRLEEFFLQRTWNSGCGWFFRLAGGYFEPAYGGGASEILFYPVHSNWAVGAESAVVWKRKYEGLGFTQKISRFTSNRTQVYEKYVGFQYFFNLHYNFKPLNVLMEIQAGQFLAKDKGVRIQATRYFPSGVRFSLWLTLTNGHDKVNRHTYYDKGFAFTIPFDLFLKKSSRSLLTYQMSAWLRDVGAISATGYTLFPTLYEERYD